MSSYGRAVENVSSMRAPRAFSPRTGYRLQLAKETDKQFTVIITYKATNKSMKVVMDRLDFVTKELVFSKLKFSRCGKPDISEIETLILDTESYIYRELDFDSLLCND